MKKDETIRLFATLDATTRYATKQITSKTRVSREDVTFAVDAIEEQLDEIRRALSADKDEDDGRPVVSSFDGKPGVDEEPESKTIQGLAGEGKAGIYEGTRPQASVLRRRKDIEG